jgi:hypothetical protein
MQIPRSPTPYCTVYKSDGTKQPDHNNNGVLLASGTTYYVPVGIDAATFIEAMLQWDAAIILTSVEVETTNNPDVALWSTVAGEWTKRNLVGAFGSLDAAAGVTALTLAVAGGTAGSAMWSLRNGALRTRLKIIVAGTGGRAICTANGKV